MDKILTTVPRMHHTVKCIVGNAVHIKRGQRCNTKRKHDLCHNRSDIFPINTWM